MSTEMEANIEQTELVNEAPEQTPAEVEESHAPVEHDDAAFLAGFNGEAVEAETPAAEPEPEPAPEPKQIAGYTEDQIKELLAKAAEVDTLRQTTAKLSGTLGAMRQSIEALKTARGAQARLSPDQFSRLRQVFPEMTDALVEDLNGALSNGISAAPSFDASVIEQTVNSRLEEASRAMEARLLTVQHPDWQQQVQSQEFSDWKASLPEQERQALDDSWDATFIGAKLSEFKGWRSKTAQAQQQQQIKRNRLEAAITPKSNAAPAAVSEEDAFIQGFKQARGIR